MRLERRRRRGAGERDRDDRRDGVRGDDERPEHREAAGNAREVQRQARAAGDDELTEDARVEIACARRRSHEHGCDRSEQRERAGRAAEVVQAAGGTVVVRVHGVQDDQDDVDDDDQSDGHQDGGDHQPAPLAQLQDLGADQPRAGQNVSGHGADSSRDVISRKRRSSETRSGSSRCTSMPASTSVRFTAAAVASSSMWTRSPSAHALDLIAAEERLRRARRRSFRRAPSSPSPRQLVDRALDDDLALVDDRDRVARLLDLVQQVRREHDRASFLDEGADHEPELLHARRVEAVHRLVEDQQLGIGEQRAGDAEALTHPERIRLHPLVRAVRRDRPARAPRRCACAPPARVRPR